MFEERVTSEINQREVWVKGEELQTAAEVWGADLFLKKDLEWQKGEFICIC